jgi:hypothetical protein
MAECRSLLKAVAARKLLPGAGQCIAQRREKLTNKSLAGMAVLMVANGLVGCSNPAAPAPSARSAPSGVSQPNPGALVVFKDPLTGLSTSDVRDAHGHVVQFTTLDELIWIDGAHLPGHQVDGPGHRLQGGAPEASCQCWLVVRFGATDGERRAYLTADVGHSNPGTVGDLEISGSALVVSWTDLFPPGTYTLSGVVTEATASGLVPIENAEVWRLDEEQSGWDIPCTGDLQMTFSVVLNRDIDRARVWTEFYTATGQSCGDASTAFVSLTAGIPVTLTASSIYLSFQGGATSQCGLPVQTTRMVAHLFDWASPRDVLTEKFSKTYTFTGRPS